MKTISFLILVLFFSCKKNVTPSYQKDEQKKIISDSFARNYNLFFKKFNEDSIFQRKRLKDSIAFYTNKNEIDSALNIRYYSKDDIYYVNYIVPGRKLSLC